MIPEARVARQLAEMTWEDAREVERARAVGVLPVGAVEAHGPHLPLGTDCVIAEAMARAGAGQLEARGVPALVLPVLPYTCAGFASGFPGTISASPASVTALVGDIARSLGAQGFRALAVANAHLDPGHLASLHAARSCVSHYTDEGGAIRRPRSHKVPVKCAFGTQLRGICLNAYAPDRLCPRVRCGRATRLSAQSCRHAGS